MSRKEESDEEKKVPVFKSECNLSVTIIEADEENVKNKKPFQ